MVLRGGNSCFGLLYERCFGVKLCGSFKFWVFLLVLVHVRSEYVRLPGTVRHCLQGPVPGDAQLHKGPASGVEACLGNLKFHLLLWSKGP